MVVWVLVETKKNKGCLGELRMKRKEEDDVWLWEGIHRNANHAGCGVEFHQKWWMLSSYMVVWVLVDTKKNKGYSG